MTHRHVNLGHNLIVGPLGYGAMSISGAYGPIAEDDALRLLDEVIESGIAFIDTADVYGEGRSEQIIGRFLASRRPDVMIASKVGLGKGSVGKRVIRGDRAYIHERIDGTLGRLGIDCLDLYYQHRIDPGVPIEETVGALAELVEAGKIRNIGLSEATGDEIRRAHAVHPIAAVQSEWNILSRDVEVHVLPTLAELGIGFVAFSPVSRGLLTDGFDPALHERDMRHGFPRFWPENLPANIELVREVDTVAKRHGSTREAVALAWLYAKARAIGVELSTIPGTRSVAHLHANLRSLDLEPTPTDVAELDTLAGRVHGKRASNPAWVSGGREGLL